MMNKNWRHSLSINDLDIMLLNIGFGEIVKTEDKPTYKSTINSLIMYPAKDVIEFEVLFGRVDGRNERLDELRNRLQENGYNTTELRYSLGLYEDQVFVYNACGFQIHDVTFEDNNEWNNIVIKYDECVYDYASKQIIHYENVKWFGCIEVLLYHSQSSSLYYNALIKNNDSNEISEFISDISVLNDVLACKSCSSSSIDCACDDDDTEHNLIRISSAGNDLMVTGINCARRTKGAYYVRDEIEKLLQKYKRTNDTILSDKSI